MRFCLFIFISLLIVSCSSTKKQAEMLEQTKPYWVKERPVDNSYYYGIGIVPKVGAPMLYEDKAKERALADISSQISSTVKSEAILYQVEDKNGVRDFLQNRIKSVSEGFLEGYEYIDKWEDLSNTYAFYRLSKEIYKELKAKRKAEALKAAKEKYLAGLELKRKGSIVPSLEHFSACIDILSGYMNEYTNVEIEGEQVDLVSESNIEIAQTITNLSIHIRENRVVSGSDDCIGIYYNNSLPVKNLPVKLEYSGGYLVNDRIKTDDNGFVSIPNLTKGESSNKLLVKVDLVYLGRQVTRNLYVRKIIENQKAAEFTVDV